MKRINPELSFKYLGAGVVLIFVGIVFLKGFVAGAERPWAPIVWITLVLASGLIIAGLVMVFAGGRSVGESLAVAELQLLCEKRPEGYAQRVRELGEKLHGREGMEKMKRVHAGVARIAGPAPAGCVEQLWAGIGEWGVIPTAPATIGNEAAILAELYEIYSTHPQGFVLPRFAAAVPAGAVLGPAPQANRIRELGDVLNSRGGMPMMLRVHADFARRAIHIPGAARNLEIMWDQIGEWLG